MSPVMDLSVSSFSSVNFYFIYFTFYLLGAYSFRNVMGVLVN